MWGPRLALAGGALAVGLACTGFMGESELEPDAPHPLLEPSPWWAAGPPKPAGPVLRRASQVCAGQDTRWSWNKDLSFEVATPQAKVGGTWRDVDGDLVYLATGPVPPEPRCTHARFLGNGDLRVLLCAQGTVACPTAAAWAAEILDAGAGPASTELVARVLARVDPTFGEGVVFRGGEAQAASEIQILYRRPAGPNKIRPLAEHMAWLVQRDLTVTGVEVLHDPEGTSPIVIRVAGGVSERSEG